MKQAAWFIFILLALVCAGCAVQQPDYALFEQHKPQSILILPPLNNTASVDAPDKYLSTITTPVAERGYYVFPVAVVDRMFKENGVISAVEMRQVSRDKLREIFGADAVLDVTIDEWGTQYMVISSSTVVALTYRLFDLGSGQELWSRTERLVESSNGGSSSIESQLVGALVDALASTVEDREIEMSYRLNNAVIGNGSSGLLTGHRWVEER